MVGSRVACASLHRRVTPTPAVDPPECVWQERAQIGVNATGRGTTSGDAAQQVAPGAAPRSGGGALCIAWLDVGEAFGHSRLGGSALRSLARRIVEPGVDFYLRPRRRLADLRVQILRVQIAQPPAKPTAAGAFARRGPGTFARHERFAVATSARSGVDSAISRSRQAWLNGGEVLLKQAT